MAEMVVSASEFRVGFKDLANLVAAEQQRIVVTRHGHPMGAWVSEEDMEFLRKHKPQPTLRTVPDPVPDPLEGIDHPERMSIEDVERIYRITRDSSDPAIQDWRGKAFGSIRARTGKYPADPPIRFG